MAWSLEANLRAEVVERATACVTAVRFFSSGKAASELIADTVKQLEQRAYAKAEMASQVTTGARPHVEGVRMYTHDLGVLLKELLQGGLDAEMPDASAASTTEFSVEGAREVVNKERAESLLAPLLAADAGYVTVKLSTKSFGAGSADVAAAALANNAATLQHADLSDIIAGRPEAEALAALTTVCAGLSGCKLHSLDLSDNALGEKGVRAVAGALQSQPAVRSLSFQNDGISVHAARALLEILPAPHNLHKLHFFNNMSGDEGAFAIAQILTKATQMEDFRMSSTRVMEAGGLALAKAFAAGKSLKRLDLKDNSLGSAGGLALAHVLAAHPGLTHVQLSETALGNTGAVALVNSLAQHCPQLQVLELGCNDLTPSGAKRMAPAIAAMRQLRKLNLSENELGDKGIWDVGAALMQCPLLEEVDLKQCCIQAAGGVALAQALAVKPTMRLLSLNGNAISSEGVAQMRFIFGHEAAVCVGGQECLGSLSDNEEDGEVDIEDEEDEDDEDEVADQLNDVLSKLKV